jgi:NAD(P)-dependent dehydrogenase (short-subunit alcohol dehydrogenase family)
MTSSLFDLAGKTVVVIGGTSGIGRALALGLADAGADVVASSRRTKEVDETATAIEAKSRKTLRANCDVTSRESLQALLAKTVSAFGKVDVLVNCAGITRKAPTVSFQEETWNEIIDINLSGTFRACQIFGEHMLERKSGRIINIASLGAFLALLEVAAYSASKAAVVSLTQSLAVEWSRHGVLVNAIVPGVFRTALNSKLLDGTARGAEFLMRTPMGRFGKIEELVGAAVYLSSDAASFVTGTALVVDGGILASGVNQ